MTFSIIIPVYNEEKTVSQVIDKVQSVKLPGNLNKEIIVVNDGSSDKTSQILKQYATTPSIKVFSHDTNKGKTAAITTGIKESSGDILIIQDADLEYPPQNYPALLEPILHDNAPIVYGSRFKGNIKNMTLINRLANRTTNITLNLLFSTNITDCATCFKVFKKEVLKDITIESSHFAFETEITAKLLKRGYKIVEVPIEYVARKADEGKKITWKLAMGMYWALIKYKFFDHS